MGLPKARSTDSSLITPREERENLLLENAPIRRREPRIQSESASYSADDHPSDLIGRVPQAREQALLLQRGLLSVSMAIVMKGFVLSLADRKWIECRNVS